MKQLLFAFVGLSAVSATSMAQSFNIDLGNAASTPSSSYGAAGLPGVWNSYSMLPNGSVLPLVGLNGAATFSQIRNIGGTQLLEFDNPATTGNDAALVDDMLISFNNPTDACLFIENVQNGNYEVLMYAITPNDSGLLCRTRVDFANEGPAFIGGAWPGSHQLGVTYSRHTVTVTNNRLGLHSGLPSGFIQSGINAVQVRLIVPPPPCPGDANADNQINSADLSVLLSQFGSSVPASTGADFNADGAVNSADLSVLLSAFSGSC